MSRPAGDSTVPSLEQPPHFYRQWTLIIVVALGALPAPVLHLLDFSGGPYPDLPSVVEMLIFGLGVFAAATLLTWASEVAETEMPAALALVVLALIAVMPEYAVDLYFAWTAPDTPSHAHLAIANMTGGNRLLVGLAWPVIFFIFYMRTRVTQMPVERSNSLGILFLAAATIYSFSIPIRGNLSLIDTGVMFSLFILYLYISFRSAPEDNREFVGPAAAIAALGKKSRRAVVIAVFLYAAAVIFAAAEPFANSLVDTGKSAGVDEFVLVQWVAPLASESPEFILAGLLALRGRHDAGMTILISSKVNQWTLLIGSLPLAYSISGGTLHPLEFDARQSEEVFLTAGQSLFAVAILFSLTMARWEALALAALFLTQFFFTDTSVRLGYAGVYTTLGILTILRDTRSSMPAFLRAARDTALAHRHRELAGADRSRSPPG